MIARISVICWLAVFPLVGCIVQIEPSNASVSPTSIPATLPASLNSNPTDRAPFLDATQPAENSTEIAEGTTQPSPDDQAAPEASTASAGRPFVLQPGSPKWLPNFSHPEAGCNWMGVAGQVFDANGDPVMSLVAETQGVLEGIETFVLSVTGVTSIYGPGSFEIQLADHAIDSSGVLWLQIKNLEGKELTDRISLDTFADCDRNLILVNFVPSGSQQGLRAFFVPLFYNNHLGEQFSPFDESPSPDQTEQIFFPLFYHEYFRAATDEAAP